MRPALRWSPEWLPALTSGGLDRPGRSWANSSVRLSAQSLAYESLRISESPATHLSTFLDAVSLVLPEPCSNRKGSWAKHWEAPPTPIKLGNLRPPETWPIRAAAVRGSDEKYEGNSSPLLGD